MTKCTTQMRPSKRGLFKAKELLWNLSIAVIFLFGFIAAGGVLAVHAGETEGEGIEIIVYKSPKCDCCNNWIDHLNKHGFKVKAVDRIDLPILKVEQGITEEVASCHTALVGDYVVEGHVPADAIKRLLREHPQVKGIAVPGMPLGSPGMEGPHSQRYNILTFDEAGKTSVYEER